VGPELSEALLERPRQALRPEPGLPRLPRLARRELKVPQEMPLALFPWPAREQNAP